MDLETRFEEAAERAGDLPRQDDETLLRLYALYKQATAGDAGHDRPGGFSFVARAKHDAWAARRGMSREEAMQAYVDLVDALAG